MGMGAFYEMDMEGDGSVGISYSLGPWLEYGGGCVFVEGGSDV
jgi:hypothetical protein